MLFRSRHTTYNETAYNNNNDPTRHHISLTSGNTLLDHVSNHEETTANRDSITLVNPSLYMLRTRKLNSHALNACSEIATTVGNLDITSLTVHYRNETIDPSFATVIQIDRNQLTPTKNDSINDQGTLDKTSIKYLLTPTKTISSTPF